MRPTTTRRMPAVSSSAVTSVYDSVCLILADLEHEPAAGTEDLRPVLHDGAVEHQPVLAAVECAERLIVAH